MHIRPVGVVRLEGRSILLHGGLDGRAPAEEGDEQQDPAAQLQHPADHVQHQLDPHPPACKAQPSAIFTSFPNVILKPKRLEALYFYSLIVYLCELRNHHVFLFSCAVQFTMMKRNASDIVTRASYSNESHQYSSWL